MWEEQFNPTPDADFVAACKLARAKERFFPAPAAVFQALEELKSSRVQSTLALPEHIRGPEGERRFSINAAMARIAFRDERAKEYFACRDEVKKDEIARGWLGENYRERDEERPRQRGPVHVGELCGVRQ